MTGQALTLLAASNTLVIILMMTNAAQASPVMPTVSISASNAQVTNLNLVNASLILSDRESNPVLHSLGCTCAICTGASQSTSL